VKALAVAQSQGQKVFTVTSQNVAAVLPQLTGHSAQTKADVQNAVNAGKEVTISQARITYSGWTGAGYVIIDPQTGAGSYLIEGGANGGNLTPSDVTAGAFGVLSMVLWANKLAFLSVIPGVNVYLTLALAITALLAAQYGDDINASSKVQQQIGLQVALGSLSSFILASGLLGPIAAILFLTMLVLIARQATIAYLT
jgi:hypothetical protein